MSEGAIVKLEGNGLAVAAPSNRAIILAEALETDTEQRRLLGRYIGAHMKDGTDFGKIPGTEKPTLLKPGAEKLVDLFRCTPKFKLVERQEDFDKGFFNYMFRVQLVSRDAGVVLAEGYGSCNSREGRYRWRNATRKCPTCGKESIIKGDPKYGAGWVCWKKKDGCGTKFADGAPAIESQPGGKVENDDIATMANTILKMAKKRALVDGAIALARCSDMFTQDVEDLEPDVLVEKPMQGTADLKAKLAAKIAMAPPPAPTPPASRQTVDARPEPPPPESMHGAEVSNFAPPPEREPGSDEPDPDGYMTFGSSKGKHVTMLTERDLAWYGKTLTESVADPEKARWREKNDAQLNAVRNELKKREA